MMFLFYVTNPGFVLVDYGQPLKCRLDTKLSPFQVSTSVPHYKGPSCLPAHTTIVVCSIIFVVVVVVIAVVVI